MAQFEGLTSTCKKAILMPTGADAAGYKLLYKLPPSTMGSASSVEQDPVQDTAQVHAKTMPSGIYARMVIPDDRLSNWLLVGTDLDTEARTFSSAPQASLWRTGSEHDCRSLCDNSNVCWGFIFDGVSKCLFRGGLDALSTRSFLVLPSGVDLSPFKWQGATALESAIGTTLVLASQRNATVDRNQAEAALVAIFAQTGVYDPVAALQRILDAPAPLPLPSPPPGQDTTPTPTPTPWPSPPPPPPPQPEQNSTTPTPTPTPWPSPPPPPPPQPGQDTLAAAVAAVQAAAAARSLLVPTWVTAVAALLPNSPGAPQAYDVTSASDLLVEAFGAAPQVESLVKKDNMAGVTTQQIVDALLAGGGALNAQDAFNRLKQQRQAADNALDKALKAGALVSLQQVYDAVNITFKSASGSGAADLAVQLTSSASKMSGQLTAASVLTSDQLHTVLMSVHLDYRTLELDVAAQRVAAQRVSALLGALKALVPQAQATGLSERQAADLLLLAFAYRRQYSVEWALSVLPLLTAATKQLLLTSTDNPSGSEAIDHLLAVYGQSGSLSATA